MSVWILVASLSLIAYAYAGYPILCALRAKIRSTGSFASAVSNASMSCSYVRFTPRLNA